jgi:transcriptional regulator GlxA family with amidase domain
MMTNANPASGGMYLKNVSSGSSPPAEAPRLLTTKTHCPMALVAALFGSHDESGRTNNSSGLARWQLRRMLEFLEAHPAQDIGLDELAWLVGLSQSRFERAFKASTSLPPHKWCLHNRIRRAQELLLNGSGPLSEIATHNGFADHSHFHRNVPPCNWNNSSPGGIESSVG